MQVWRIAKARFASDLSGQGAALFGGRWNHIEQRALYFGLTPAICALETFIHATQVPRFPLKIIRVSLPDDPELYWQPSIDQLPEGWDAKPADSPSMDFGSRWLQQRQQLGLIVPSSVMTYESNIMINPDHPAVSQIKILSVADFAYDSRMFSPRN
ncbi:MAG: RES family NAD+ phosphorylase [Pseudomonas sp.]